MIFDDIIMQTKMSISYLSSLNRAQSFIQKNTKQGMNTF